MARPVTLFTGQCADLPLDTLAQKAAEWGYDLQRAIDDAGAGIWWTGLFPGLAIVLLVTGFTLVGEGLNDVLNPRIRKRRIERPEMPE